MEYYGIAEKLLDQQFEIVCKKLKESDEELREVHEGNTEDHAKMVIASTKQKLQLNVEQGREKMIVIKTEEWGELIDRLRFALQDAFEEAKRLFQPLLKTDAAMRQRFWALTNFVLPDCSETNSSYMRQNFPRFLQHRKKMQIWKKDRKEGTDVWDLVQEQIQMVVSMECLFDLKEQMSQTLKAAREKQHNISQQQEKNEVSHEQQ